MTNIEKPEEAGKGFVNADNTQNRPTGDYAAVIKEIAAKGVCPFCESHLWDHHKKPVITKKFWLLTDNMYPYKPSRHHRLFIIRRHVSHLNEITLEEWLELYSIIRGELEERAIEGGTLIMRFGNTRYNGASVSHLHAHLVQSDPDSPDYDKTKGVIMRIG